MNPQYGYPQQTAPGMQGPPPPLNFNGNPQANVRKPFFFVLCAESVCVSMWL